MTDDKIIYIWDQKPPKRGGAFMGDHFEWKDPHYDDDEMDAWLDKLKLLYEALAKTVIEQDKIISQFKENEDNGN